MQKTTSLEKKHFQEECEMQETTSLENKHFQEEHEMQETTYSSKTKHSQEECEKQRTTSLPVKEKIPKENAKCNRSMILNKQQQQQRPSSSSSPPPPPSTDLSFNVRNERDKFPLKKIFPISIRNARDR
jgi:hypothetical protein